MQKHLITLAIVLTIIVGMFVLVSDSRKTSGPTFGSAISGSVAVLATSSTIAVGPGTNKNMLFTNVPFCSSRIVSTGSNPILLSFDSATTTANPGGTIGFIQAASTTVAYDSGIYGCTAVSAYGYTASTTVTIAEFR